MTTHSTDQIRGPIEGPPPIGFPVTITVNNRPVTIHSGRRSVAEIKTEGKVPLADDLEQIVDGKMNLLPDDGHVIIHGHEVFVSHPKSTSSS